MEWLLEMRRLPRELMLDATGRSTVPFASVAAGITPDIIVTAKALANGFPIGLTLTTDAVSETMPGGAHGTPGRAVVGVERRAEQVPGRVVEDGGEDRARRVLLAMGGDQGRQHGTG